MAFRKADESLVCSDKLDSFSKSELFKLQLLSLLSTNKCTVFLQFLNKGSTVIFLLFIFISTTYIITISIYLRSKFSLSFRATFCFTNLDYLLIRITLQFLRISESLPYLFHVIFRINKDDFPTKHKPTGLCNAEAMCFL
jgi:uncharacterized protein VirK/YbjX